jgi:hypothetical protein
LAGAPASLSAHAYIVIASIAKNASTKLTGCPLISRKPEPK